MPVEIERKFVVTSEGWREAALGPAVAIRQGYVVDGGSTGMTVRVRLYGDQAFLTLKSPGLMKRAEFETPFDVTQAQEMLDAFCVTPPLSKRRTRVRHGELVWEIDEFEGALAGLVLAEVELMREEQPVELPAWVGREVTGDPRFQNAALARVQAVPQPRDD